MNIPDDRIIEVGERVWARYWVPIQPEMLASIEQMLASQGVFCTTFRPDPQPLQDPYRAITYRHQTARFGTECRLLLDRNVVTRLVALARGRRAESAHRIAAGVLAFAQCAGLLIEPGMALYEFAEVEGDEAARRELTLFRALDNVHPGFLAEIALGLTDSVPRGEVTRAADRIATTEETLPPVGELEKPLRDYRISYHIALRVAVLALSKQSSEAKATGGRVVRAAVLRHESTNPEVAPRHPELRAEEGTATRTQRGVGPHAARNVGPPREGNAGRRERDMDPLLAR